MIETVKAIYGRESTLWKNANLFYKQQDWTTMICSFLDYSIERSDYLTKTDARNPLTLVIG